LALSVIKRADFPHGSRWHPRDLPSLGQAQRGQREQLR
jgi:hypothetical protein